LGATSGQVIGIFTVQGMIIAGIGVITGVITGLTILKFRNEIRAGLSRLNIEIFPSDVYGLPELPAHLRPEDFIWICIPAFLLCSLAALIPALRSCAGDPSRELRGGAQ
jgi:lipoprotein-releasing system permease protein